MRWGLFSFYNGGADEFNRVPSAIVETKPKGKLTAPLYPNINKPV